MPDPVLLKAASLETEAPEGAGKAGGGSSVRRSKCLVALGLLVSLALVLGVTIPLVLVSQEEEEGSSCPWGPRGPRKRFAHSDEESGFDHAEMVSADCTYVTQKVSIPFADGSGQELRLEYNGTLIENATERIISLDYDERVVDVTCVADVITIAWSSPDIPEAKVKEGWLDSTFVTGSAEWNCSLTDYEEMAEIFPVNTSSANYTTIQHRVVEVLGVQGAELSLRVKPCSLVDLFEDLDVYYESVGAEGPINTSTWDTYEDKSAILNKYPQTVLGREYFLDVEPVTGTMEFDEDTEFDAHDTEPEDEWDSRVPFLCVDALGENVTELSTDSGRALISCEESAVSTERHGRQLLFRRVRRIGRAIRRGITRTVRAAGRVVGTAARFAGRVTSFVQEVATVVGEVARAIVSGNLQLGSKAVRTLRSWDWSGPDFRDRNGNGIDLSRSHAHLSLGVQFYVSIRRWRLRQATLAVQGDASLTAGADIHMSGRDRIDENFQLIRAAGLGSVTFMVGPLPLRIAGYLDLDGTVQADSDGNLDASAAATATAHLRVGIEFRNRRWRTIHDRHWGTHRERPSMQVASRANVGVGLTPTIFIMAAWIGGPFASVAPYVSIDMSSFDNEWGPSCTSDIGWGLDIHVGARIDLQNPITGRPLRCSRCRHEFAQRTIFSTGTRPLFECDRCSRIAAKGATCTAWRAV